MEFHREPLCKACRGEFPLLAKNKDAIRIWRLTESQMIVAGMGGVVGVNQLAVWEAIDRYRVKEPLKTFEKVLKLFQDVTMARVNEDS